MDIVGLCDTVGLIVGEKDGTNDTDGESVGCTVGAPGVGEGDGIFVGLRVGKGVGLRVGRSVLPHVFWYLFQEQYVVALHTSWRMLGSLQFTGVGAKVAGD